ncbi:MAG: hypothetical protein ORN85_03170 [Sediminibacterium sp.]|nr:hypothetical protein [Sediminibacterium sp.]
MNRSIFIIMVASCFLFSSCATIFGGRNYNAIINTNRPNATIIVNNQFAGTGHGVVAVPRKDANKLNIVLKEKGCNDTVFSFRSRKIRGFALAGAIAPWAFFTTTLISLSNPRTSSIIDPYNSALFVYTGLYISILSFYPSIVDFANFSTMYKPDILEKGVYKKNYKNYEYRLQSTCTTDDEFVSEKEPLRGTIYLKNGNIIKGQIIEIVPNVRIKIQTLDGSILVFSFDEIQKYSQ